MNYCNEYKLLSSAKDNNCKKGLFKLIFVIEL